MLERCETNRLLGGKDLKYTLVERERRFLLAGPPEEPSIRTVAVTDRYLIGTRLRLRRVAEPSDSGEEVVYKLTQKIPGADSGSGLITTIYLSEDEYRALSVLPAAVLQKTRHSVPPFGIDLFSDVLTGLYLAEAEFENDDDMAGFVPASFAVAEVTGDQRFTGGYLATATRQELAAALADYGLRLR